jgi:hypothetical protein
MLVVVCAALVASAASATVRPGQQVIQGDYRLGAFAVKADATLFGAIQAFGKPSLRRSPYQTCTASWAKHGLTISFYNLGGEDACKPQYGYFGEARIRGANWRTASGLAIGDPARWITRYHKQARWHAAEQPYWPEGWWLVTRWSVYGDGSNYPGLLAVVRDGKVSEFRMRYQGGGD